MTDEGAVSRAQALAAMASKMLRVLTLSSLYPNIARPNQGGFIARQTEGLAERDDVAVEVVTPIGLPLWPLSLHPHYTPTGRLPHWEEWNGVSVHRPRFLVWPKLGEAAAARFMAIALLPFLRKLRERFPFDVIDAEFFWPDGPAAVRLGKALGVPVSIKARGSDVHYWPTKRGVRSQIAWAAREADGLLAVSAPLKDDLVKLGAAAERIRVHYTGVDTGLFRPVDRAAAKAELGIDGPLLLSVGTLIERKGQRLALRALARLPEATLFLVGGGPDRARLESLARELGVESRTRFLGVLPHRALPELFATADVMVLPTASEGLANVWVEALACGTPVVTTDVGGAPEVIDRPAAGRLVPRDAAAIAAAVKELLAGPPAQDAAREAATRFSWDVNRDALFEHLSGLARD